MVDIHIADKVGYKFQSFSISVEYELLHQDCCVSISRVMELLLQDLCPHL